MQQESYLPAQYPVPATNGRTTRVCQRIRECIIKVDRTLTLWHSRASSRREMARLDEQLLKDMRIDPIELHKEASKPFWRE